LDGVATLLTAVTVANARLTCQMSHRTRFTGRMTTVPERPDAKTKINSPPMRLAEAPSRSDQRTDIELSKSLTS
jgi:hypothetical protein